MENKKARISILSSVKNACDLHALASERVWFTRVLAELLAAQVFSVWSVFRDAFNMLCDEEIALHFVNDTITCITTQYTLCIKRIKQNPQEMVDPARRDETPARVDV